MNLNRIYKLSPITPKPSKPVINSGAIEIFLNQILEPYESIIIRNPQLKNKIETIIMKYQFEFDTRETRSFLEEELKSCITDFIIDNRNKKIDKIL